MNIILNNVISTIVALVLLSLTFWRCVQHKLWASRPNRYLLASIVGIMASIPLFVASFGGDNTPGVISHLMSPPSIYAFSCWWYLSFNNTDKRIVRPITALTSALVCVAMVVGCILAGPAYQELCVCKSEQLVKNDWLLLASILPACQIIVTFSLILLEVKQRLNQEYVNPIPVQFKCVK